MKNKKLIGILLCIAVAAAGVAAGYAYGTRTNNEVQTTVAETTMGEPVTEQTSSGTTHESTTAEELSTEEETKEQTADITFAKKGYWYLFDEDNKVAYAIALEGTSKVKLAYFNRENTSGDDAKYYTGEATYSVKGNKIIIKNLPSEAGISTLEITVDGDKLIYKNTELENEAELSLDIPFEHFNP